MTIIEAVPNVSEGRRQNVIAALVDSVQKVPGSRLLDHSSDPAHNRTVLTLVGDAASLTTALLRLFEVATDTIDLRTHRGEHPRVGAVDVVPFIPLQDASTDDCVTLATMLGKTVAERFEIPVYLYGSAASRTERRALEDIRRGQLAGLTGRMSEESWRPDFGPNIPHPTAGVSVIGVRGPLIAFNVSLDTDDLDVAREIAGAIRTRRGGLPGVKAIGVRLADRAGAQVSMNLTDYTQTPIHRAFDYVKREADKRGVGILNSEVVGLVPANALIPTALRYLQLDTFRPDQVLDARLCPEMHLPPPAQPSAEE